MRHEDLITLIRGGVEGGGTWADLGSGAGAFTLTLAELLPRSAVIYSVDRDADAIRIQKRTFAERFPGFNVRFITGDFTQGPDLPELDGVLAANSLHFVGDRKPLLVWLSQRLRSSGRLIVVEYNIERPNPWVPNPLPYSLWVREAEAAGLGPARLMAVTPSRYHHEIYSAVSEGRK